MSDLLHKRCVPCEGGVDPLTPVETARYLDLVEGWEDLDHRKIRKGYRFKDFAEALRFVDAVGALAESEGHHPDLFLYAWNQVEITLFTHAIQGLHLNDFVLAAKIDALHRERFPGGER